MKPLPFPKATPIIASACLTLALSAHAQEPAKEPASEQAKPEKKVFAHYMVCFFGDTDFYKREIELAQRHGIDGFALNAGDWNPDNDQHNYVSAATRMYAAAQELGTGFKLFFSPDANGPGAKSPNVVDMVKRFGDHPNQFRHDDKAVLSAWAGQPATYKHPIDQLKAAGKEVFFVPFVFPPKFPANWSSQTVRRFFTGNDWMNGIFYFAADGTTAEIIRTNASARKITQELGKVYMAGVAPAFNSPNLRDFRGLSGYDAVWRGIIRDSADWVEIVTWSDYQEDSNLMPYRWAYPPMSEQYLFSRDESFLDVTGYYAAWFKAGAAPEITQDKIYFTYRNRPSTLTKAWDHRKEAWIDIRTDGHRVDQIHDDVEDNIYVTTFLTAPADLTVEIGGKKQTFTHAPGVHHAAVPMAPGVPHFTLSRKGKKLLEVDGRKEIVAEATQENSMNGLHLSNRTWTGGAVVGKGRSLSLADAQLLGDAKREGKSVAITHAHESGLKLPLQDLKTGTYNLRITYRNPEATESRLTLQADGAHTAEKGTPPHHIPAFFPPTGKEKKTISFLWSLFEKSSYLQLSVHAPETREKQSHPWRVDRGGVTIESIEIIPVDPVKSPEATPENRVEMVAIPGGSFKMGSADAHPDEAPVREVTVGTFAIGKFEITNAQYEAFDPAHRSMRDDFSWRDSDPVIYVAWTDAAKYCNWLSARHQLSPAYDEKTWEILPESNGYRLPTEAQWEYAASGRGETRRYPWGNEEPTPEYGQFALKQALNFEDALHGRGLSGTTAVGSYPQGASRDGIMDLAGNVSEWCADVFIPNPETKGKDPINLKDEASGVIRYRSIRGGSWGYYGFDQRVTNREFNNPGYPGYIYIGFRVALPEAGYRQLEKQ